MLGFLSSLPGLLSLVGIIVLIITSPRFKSVSVQASNVNTIMRVVVSLVVLAAALYVILSQNYESDTQKWAFGAVGMVIGYWLPSNR